MQFGTILCELVESFPYTLHKILVVLCITKFMDEMKYLLKYYLHILTEIWREKTQ